MNEVNSRSLPSDDQVEVVEHEIAERYPDWTLVSLSANAGGNVEESWRAEILVNSSLSMRWEPARRNSLPPSKASRKEVGSIKKPSVRNGPTTL